jgi:7-carboxy-7-deazaguanine synthase
VTAQAPALAGAPPRSKLFPIIEVFGPTVQGEGAEAGVPTHFVRLGGCDYRCSWCDTMYAVDPGTVRERAVRLGAADIVDRIDALAGRPEWVTISGGNPALHKLGPVVDALQQRGYRVGVETQGSVWRDWLASVDRLTISPKPPSSGMATRPHGEQFQRFMHHAAAAIDASPVLKIVCFDEIDLAWAKAVAAGWPQLPLYLSAGTPIPPPADIRAAVAARFRWLCEGVAADPDLARARVLPQLHVIAWEDATGV